ncbi:hypothetical protein CRUP_013533 [Coryphaenoides rupestris]|nr:hypothetical protein CRUP_013533 [Coryphaenoides rupestris]
MILKLNRKVQLTEKVKKIELAGWRESLPQNCTVCGWGYSKEKRDMASELREVDVTLEDIESCAKHSSYCSTGDIGPYHGDSGGPLVCEGGLAFGFVSFRTGGKPWPIVNVFGKIPAYLDWINEQMREMSNQTLVR